MGPSVTRIYDLIKEKPRTVKELALITKLSVDRISTIMKKLSGLRLIHHSDYTRTVFDGEKYTRSVTGPWAAVWAEGAGDGTIPEPPDAMDNAEKLRRYRRKRRAEKQRKANPIKPVLGI